VSHRRRPERDAQTQGVDARATAPHKPVPLLRAAELADAYEQAWDEWSAADGPGLWDSIAGDGSVNDPPR